MELVLTKDGEQKQARNLKAGTNLIEINLKKRKIALISQRLIDQMLLNQINSDLDKLIIKIFDYLTEEDDDAETTGLLYDELAKQRSIILNNYEKKLSGQATQKYMRKIRIAAFELKKRLRTYTKQKTEVKAR